MSELRDRIAAVLFRFTVGDATGINWADTSDPTTGVFTGMADAVIAELGLTVTGGVIVGCLHEDDDE